MLLNLFTGYSQTVIDVKGKVICKKTGEPITFGAVNLKEIEQWTTTDENGFFEFHQIVPGTYTLEISCLGYKSHSAPILIEKDKYNFANLT